MTKIAILSSSVRTERKSHRVALFFKAFLETNYQVETDIIDLAEYDFPLFHERLRLLPDPSENILHFAGRIKSADGIIFITPEYNGGYPASLKNVIDLLFDEWKRKPIALAAVSDGPFGGSQVILALQAVMWKIGAYTVPAKFHVAKVSEAYDQNGVPSNAAASEKAAKGFMDELLWLIGKFAP